VEVPVPEPNVNRSQLEEALSKGGDVRVVAAAWEAFASWVLPLLDISERELLKELQTHPDAAHSSFGRALTPLALHGEAILLLPPHLRQQRLTEIATDSGLPVPVLLLLDKWWTAVRGYSA